MLRTGVKSYAEGTSTLFSGKEAVAKFRAQPYVAPMLQARFGAAAAAERTRGIARGSHGQTRQQPVDPIISINHGPNHASNHHPI